jgi:hypothetical protein
MFMPCLLFQAFGASCKQLLAGNSSALMPAVASIALRIVCVVIATQKVTMPPWCCPGAYGASITQPRGINDACACRRRGDGLNMAARETNDGPWIFTAGARALG